MNWFLDFHGLHTVPAANLNRDMAGLPKTVTLGGALRARVSSQSWNAAMREHMIDISGIAPGTRTRDVLSLIKSRDETAVEPVRAMLSSKSNKTLGFDTKTGLLKTVFFFTDTHVDALIALSGEAGVSVNERLSDILTDKTNMNADVALFGSTLTSHPAASVRGALSSMHSFSTHEVNLEFDEFTGGDDMTDERAAHLGVRDFVSATFYRFSTINLSVLGELVGGERVPDVATAFLSAFAETVPAARQSSFHAATRPDMVAVMLRQGKPEPYSGAFDTPIKPAKSGGLIVPSLTAFNEQHQVTTDVWGAKPERMWMVSSVPVVKWGDKHSKVCPLPVVRKEVSKSLGKMVQELTS